MVKIHDWKRPGRITGINICYNTVTGELTVCLKTAKCMSIVCCSWWPTIPTGIVVLQQIIIHHKMLSMRGRNQKLILGVFLPSETLLFPSPFSSSWLKEASLPQSGPSNPAKGFRGAVASPGFVARRGKDWNCHGALTVTTGPGAEAVRWLIVLRLMQ